VTDGSGRADLVSAWAIGIGVGLIALQLTWLTANRVASVFWEAPTGPTIAFTTAILVGIAVSIVAGRRLARKTTDATRA
jgi:MFS superfamily sulfate permease-like transporter